MSSVGFELQRIPYVIRLLAAACVVMPFQAFSQSEVPVDAAAESSGIEEIVVTATRVKREGFEAPTPTTVVDSAQIEKMGSTNIGDILAQMPAAQAEQNGSTNTRGSAAGRRFANIRSLGSQRTLVLMDGQRLVPNALTGQVDLNVVPQILVEGMEVVTGGASAQWGSDAVAGVVNIITKKSIDGFETDFSYGMTDEGDNKEKKIGLAYGTSFAEGRGNFIIGGEWVDNEGIGTMYERDWGREEWGTVPNAGFGTNGLPRTLVLPHVRRNVLVAAGIISSGPLAGTTFNADGTARPFEFGSPTGSGSMSGGEGYGLGDAASVLLGVPVERAVGQARVSYELTPTTTVFGQLAYNYVHASSLGPSIGDSVPRTIYSGNPYIPASVQAQMDALGLESFQLTRFARDDIYGTGPGTSTLIDNYSRGMAYTAGIQGAFDSGWTWDAYAQYSSSELKYTGSGYRITARYPLAIDAVRNDAGEIVCRSTLTDPTNGCVPLNPFGPNSVTPEAFNYITGTQRTTTLYDRFVVAANLNGEPFSTWAGPVSVATGLEYRRDEGELKSETPLAVARGFDFGNAQPLKGSDTVTEAYVETVVPLLADAPFAQMIDFNGAVRQTKYDLSGNVTTWKIGLNYTVDNNVRFRTSLSRDIRAPNLSELYTTTTSGNANVTNPVTGANLTLRTNVGGNPDLTLERAKTFTAGVVVTPEAVPGLKLSLDYYDIQVDDIISSIGAQQAVDFCYRDNIDSFCALINRLSEQTAEIRLPMLNLAELRISGYDAEVAYGFDLSDISAMPGRLDLSYVLTYQPTAEFGGYNRAGDMGTAGAPYGGPKVKWNSYLTYSLNAFTSTVGLRYVGSGVKNVANGPNDISDNGVDDVTYVSLAFGYDLPTFDSGMEMRLYANVQNLFDRNPPVNPISFEGNPANPKFHDVIGRNFIVGVKAKF